MIRLFQRLRRAPRIRRERTEGEGSEMTTTHFYPRSEASILRGDDPRRHNVVVSHVRLRNGEEWPFERLPKWAWEEAGRYALHTISHVRLSPETTLAAEAAFVAEDVLTEEERETWSTAWDSRALVRAQELGLVSELGTAVRDRIRRAVTGADEPHARCAFLGDKL